MTSRICEFHYSRFVFLIHVKFSLVFIRLLRFDKSTLDLDSIDLIVKLILHHFLDDLLPSKVVLVANQLTRRVDKLLL